MSKDIHHHITPPPFAPIPPYDGHPHPFPHRHEAPRNHSARFRPMMLHPHIPHHFNFWCNKVIPLAYDDSLSYYEVLAKVADYLNNMLNDEKMMMINVEELAQAFCELQGFVNDYFAFYQSKGIINFEAAITNDNYLEILPDVDNAQMNTVYRMQFVEGSTQNVPANLPESAKPYNHEAVLFNLSNFVVKRVGNEWLEVTDDNKEYSTKGNYQLFITDRDIYFRENNGDTWGDWNSIFANWWSSEFENVKTWVREYVTPLVNDLSARIAAEVARATAAEQALDNKIEAETDRATAAEQAETDRATAAEQALSQRLVAEYERAAARENELEQAIEDETDRAEQVEGNLQTAIQTETTRATAAEGAIRTDLNAEVTRATARENEISGDIADIARDLSEEIVDRQQADENLQDSIGSVAQGLATETQRAQGIEQQLSNEIAAEVQRAQGAETGITQMVENGYIPNAGNSYTGMGLNIDRSSITLKSFSTTLSTDLNGAPNSYIQLSPSMITIDSNAGSGNEGISGKILIDTSRVDISHGNAGGYVGLKVGSSATSSDNTTLYLYGRNSNPSVVMHGSTAQGSFDFTQSPTQFNVSGMGNGSYYAANLTYNGVNIAATEYGCFNISPSMTAITQGTASVTSTPTGCKIYLTNGTAYLHKAGESESIPNSPYELVRKADIAGLAPSSALQGYIPNAGNSIADDFTLVRDDISFKPINGVNTSLNIGVDGVIIRADKANTYIDVGYNTDVDDIDIHAEDGAVKFITDNITLQAADNDVTIGGDTNIKIYAGDSHTLTLESTDLTLLRSGVDVIIYAPDTTTPALHFGTDYDLRWFDKYATLNIHGTGITEWNSFVNNILSHLSYGATQFVFDITNTDITIAANTKITNAYNNVDRDNILRFVNCTFNITNGNAVINIAGGHVEFENCRFVAPSYVNNKVTTYETAYAVFKNCTFENVDVECKTDDNGAVFIMENCYCSHTLFLEPVKNPTATFKIVNSYFDSNTFTIPTGQTTINAIVTGCRFGTGATLSEIRYHWGNTNIGD